MLLWSCQDTCSVEGRLEAWWSNLFENRAFNKHLVFFVKEQVWQYFLCVKSIDNKMVYSLHFTGVKLVDVKKSLGIKNATINDILVYDKRSGTDMEY